MVQLLQRPQLSQEVELPKRQLALFTTVRNEGAMLPTDLLQRLSLADASLPGIKPADYHLYEGEKLNEAISQSWNKLLGLWANFQRARANLPPADTGTTMTRERWLYPLFHELDYGRRLQAASPIEVKGEGRARRYPISHGYQHTPIHLVSCKTELDQLERKSSEGRRTSPASLVQVALNRSDGRFLWGFVTNGRHLRVLRDNVSMTRQSFVEFDLETMFDNEVYADFVLFWLLCHQSRVEAEKPEDCWLEQWSKLAREQGTRAREKLRDGVEQAISALGQGFLKYSRGASNEVLRNKLRSGDLNTQDYYRQLLRLVYRLLILFVAEDRDVLFHPDASPMKKEWYTKYYSTARLRRLANKRIGTEHADLFSVLRTVMKLLSSERAQIDLGLTPFNGFLFSEEALPDLEDCEIANHDLLDAIRALAVIQDRRTLRIVDYRNLGSEELGSVYESLLELHPVQNTDAGTFHLETAIGNERKTTGSYYTPTDLISSLLSSALDPVLEEASRQPNPEQAILDLKICDPACGSGHFLIAAGRRIAHKLASIRSGLEEPTPEDLREALRQVVGCCLYGVDINPMAVELCKFSLWLDAIEPGKPLPFPDTHILCGNSLFGATPTLLSDGIPDCAFEPIEGDDRKICSKLKARNHTERKGQLGLWPVIEQSLMEDLPKLAAHKQWIEKMPDSDIPAVHAKENEYVQYKNSARYVKGKFLADTWCAAFVWKKVPNHQTLTHTIFRQIHEGSLPKSMKEEIDRLAEQYHFFHWYLEFPDVFYEPDATTNEIAENEITGWSGGFDVVLSNPSWERIKIQEKEWFAIRKPGIAAAANASIRRKMIAALKEQDPLLYQSFMDDQREATGESHFVRDSGRYPLCGRGDVNTYALFAETMRTIINPKGCMGCIVPSGIATDDTTKYFFQSIMSQRSLVSFYDFENTEGNFRDVHRSYKFSLMTLTGSACPATRGADFVFFAHDMFDAQEEKRRFTLSARDIELMNPNTRTCPIFRSKHDMEITKDVYARVPVLIKEGAVESNPWSISFMRMFDMTNDSHLFRTRKQLKSAGWKLAGNIFQGEGETCLPLYEGKMISHFDHRFPAYEDEQAESNGEFEASHNSNPCKMNLPRYWVPQSCMPEMMNNRSALLSFRDIARSTDVRTAIFSIIPVAPCGNNLPLIILDPRLDSVLTYLATCFSSFAFDYIARQKLGGTHMNFFVLQQLPVLPPDIYKATCEWDHQFTIGKWILPRAMELTYTSWDLAAFAEDCGYGGAPFKWDDERRFLLRCELDAAYFHLYGIGREDVDYIMETFPIVKRKDEQHYGEYRTKRVILAMYDQMRQASVSSEAFASWLTPGSADDAVRHVDATNPFA